MPVWLFRRLECRRMQLGDQKYCCFSNSRTASFALSISGYLTDVNVRLMFNLWFCLNIIRDLPLQFHCLQRCRLLLTAAAASAAAE